MIYVARGIQELAREKDLSLFMCSIDLQKAYDSVDRSLLWKVLARYMQPRGCSGPCCTPTTLASPRDLRLAWKR